MFRNSKLLIRFMLFLILIGLLGSLNPISDFDMDENLDSLVTEGLLWIPLLTSVFSLLPLLFRLPVLKITFPYFFSSVLVPPPIRTK